MKLLLLLLLGSFFAPLIAGNTHSEKRLPGESMEQAYQRNYGHQQKKSLWQSSSTPYDERTHFLALSDDNVPQWKDKTALELGFKMVRDKRFLTHPSNKQFERRLTWLYPDDGCYARAELMNELLSKAGYPRPYKIFIFGNLDAVTDNTLTGHVQWWYHVAPLVKVGTAMYVLDPSLDYYNALPLVEWVKRIDSSFNGEFSVNDHKLKFAICDESSYSPDESCMQTTTGSTLNNKADAMRSLQEFLPSEWSRQIKLKRNPKDVLGDKPLWLRN